jgi:hypothetical protein
MIDFRFHPFCLKWNVLSSTFEVRYFAQQSTPTHNLQVIKCRETLQQSGSEILSKASIQPHYIDRNPEYFSHILRYLHSPQTFTQTMMTQLDGSQLEALASEAEFFGLKDLKQQCETAGRPGIVRLIQGMARRSKQVVVWIFRLVSWYLMKRYGVHVRKLIQPVLYKVVRKHLMLNEQNVRFVLVLCTKPLIQLLNQ